MNQWSQKDPREELAYGIDFRSLLRAGETVTSASAAIRATTGIDANAPSVLSGAPFIRENTQAWQNVKDGVELETYELTLIASTSLGNTYVEAGIFKVETRAD